MEISYKEVFFSFFNNCHKNIVAKQWVYKEKIYVVDVYFEGYKLGFDLNIDSGKFSVDCVVRNYKNNDKVFTSKKNNIIQSNNFEAIFPSINDFLIKIKESINSLYDFEISVIIPVYNREGLIKKCIESLNQQSLPKDKFELIFIDDFSSDKSIAVIEEGINKEINFKILKRPINSGSASAPRNDGILAAKGKYIYFIDSDDYIYEYTLKEMLTMAEENSSDIVYAKYSGDKGRPWGKRPFLKGNVSDAKISKNHLVRSLMSSKLIRSNIIKSNNIFYPLHIKVGEDRVFMMSILSLCNKFSILGEKPYYYITNHDFGRITSSGLNLRADLDINLLVFNNVSFNCGDNKSKKVELLSSWMNVFLESYVGLRLKNKKISQIEKIKYLNDLYFIFSPYSNIVSDKFIYSEFLNIYKLFINKEFEKCVQLVTSA